MKTFKIILFTPAQALAFEAEKFEVNEGRISFEHTTPKGKFSETYSGSYLVEEQLDEISRPKFEVIKP